MKTKTYSWLDSENVEHPTEELPIGRLVSLCSNKKNFFYAKKCKEVEYCGGESGSIFIKRIK
jgi:hypothetical protein